MTTGGPALQELISRLAGGRHDRSDVAALVAACHNMAAAYLRMKTAAGHCAPHRFGLPLEDLALDAVADLFARGHDGSFPVIRTLAERMLETPESSSPEHALRRFVCSMVNRRLFDLYRQSDPSLARIIRNLKLAAMTHPQIRVSGHLGEKVLVPRSTADAGAGLPVIAPELVQAELQARTSHPRSLRQVLTALADLLAETDIYRRMIPLSQAAVAIRAVLMPPPGAQEGEEPPLSELSEPDVRTLVETALGSLRSGQGRTYIRRGRLTEEELEAHLAAVRDVLLREFDGTDDDHSCFFESLRRHLDGLDRAAYAGRHRSVLEYLIRCAKGSLLGRLETGF